MPYHIFPTRSALLKLTLWSLLGSISFVPLTPVLAAVSAAEEAPVDFTADQVVYDDVNQTVTAIGKVEIAQNGKVVKADQVVYDLVKESVRGEGNVVMMEPSGDVYFADHVDFTGDLKNGFVKKLRAVLADGSRFTAEEGKRVNGNVIEMKDATYTPCEPCKLDPEKPPSWQIRAGEVRHDNIAHTITYKDATFEVGGVPVAYVPYFSHADGTIKQKSGFLTPTFSFDSQNGFGAEPRYYWAIDPSTDATFATRIYTAESPLLLGEFRKRFEDAEIEFSASTTYSGRRDSVAGETVSVDDELRGHLFGNGLWDIDDRWRAGFNLQLSSDDQYLRQYDISSDSILENEIYAERFDDRDYGVVRAIAFQDVRVSDRATDQPNIMPEFSASFYGDPNSLLGGRWNWDISALALAREGKGQDVIRSSTELGWERRDVFDIGLVNTMSASLRGDVYTIPTRDDTLTEDGDSTAGRFFPRIHNVVSYPLVRESEGLQMVFEPTASITATTDVDNDGDIPNEDSQDVQIDPANIFEADRFPGIDRVEDRSHINYGARAGLYTPDGSMAEIFLGQSYRINEDDNPFPGGSGLSEQNSDIVGHFIARYQDYLNLNYRFQLAEENMQSELHEFDGAVDFGAFDTAVSYLYARGLDGTDLDDKREQIYGSLGYSISEEWRLRTAARYDFGENEGLRRADLGVDYTGQCYMISTTARRNYTDEDTGENGTEIFLRVGLKNLGEFATGE